MNTIKEQIIKFHETLIKSKYNDFNRHCSKEDYEKEKKFQIKWLKDFKMT